MERYVEDAGICVEYFLRFSKISMTTQKMQKVDTLTPISVMIVNVKNGNCDFLRRPLVEALKKSRGNGHIIDETVSTGEGASCVMTRGTAGCLT
jgi:hypothetical protein